MKLITRNSDYALRALLYIGHTQGRLVNADELIERLKIPDAFLRRLLQQLAHAGILTSTRGKGGGFILAQNPSRIRLSEVMTVFQGRLNMGACIFKKKPCPDRSQCPLRSRISAIEKSVLRELKTTTLAALMKG